MPKLLAMLVASWLFLLFVCIPLQAQSSTATLSGTIEDERGALIPDAAIAVVNEATSFKRTANTNESGSFSIPLLPPGEYTVLVEREGFTRVQLTNIVLNVGDQKAVQVQLKVGDVASTVEVRPDASLIDTDPTVGTVVDRQFVENMPLNGRSLQSLIALTPGVVFPTAGSNPVAGGQFSVNGQRTNANYFTLDGVSANYGITTSNGGFVGQSASGSLPGSTALGGTNSMVSVDALQEFRIQTSSFAAEFGRTPGGQIQLLTRSGTKQFHGSAYDYIRNDVLDANDWFANRSGLPKAVNRQNDFGGTVGGPLPFPRFGEGGPFFDKNKTFYFFSYEALRLRQPKTITAVVPTVAVRATVPDILKPFVNAFPLPNRPSVGQNLAEVVAVISDPATINYYLVRLDHSVNSKLTLFGTFKISDSETLVRGNALNQITSRYFEDGTTTIGSTWLVSPSITNELRVNFARAQGFQSSVIDDFGGGVAPSDSLLYAGTMPPDRHTVTVIFRNSADVSTAFYTVGPAQDNRQRQFNLVDTLSWLIGSHQLKMGVDYRRISPSLSRNNSTSLQFFFTAPATLRSLQFNQVITAPNQVIYDNYSAFVQDTWQVNRRFSFTSGLRWDYNSTPRSSVGQHPSVLLFNAAGNVASLAPPGTPVYETEKGNFAPRFGISYMLSQTPGRETVIRAGGGVFFDLGTGQLGTEFSNIYPFLATRSYTSVPYPINPAISRFPILGVDPPQQFFVADKVLKLPYTLQWSAAVEQSLGPNQTVTISFVGSKGLRLLRSLGGFRTTVAGFGTGLIPYGKTINDGWSNYRALQVQYQRRLSRGIQGIASYTLADSKDTSSSDATSSSGTANQAISAGGSYAPSDYDVRHTFSGALTYEIPAAPGGRVIEAITRNWALDGLLRYRTALPTTLTVATIFNSLNGLSLQNRPNVVAGVPQILYGPQYPGGKSVNPAAFTNPANDTIGNFPRNSLRFFSASQMDLGVRRQFSVSERFKVMFKIEFFNILNHPNFADPTSFTGGGIVSSQMLARGIGGLNPLYQIGGPRSGQGSIRISF